MTSPLRTLAGTAIAAILAIPLLATPAAGSPPPAERANYKVPKIGECHLLTLEQAWDSSDSRKPVPCSSKHTTMTFAVKRLTGTVNWDDTFGLYRKLQRKCWNAFENRLGSSALVRAQTAYTWFWFSPSKAQIRRGAKWLRCDLALSGGTKLMPIKADVSLSSTKISDRVRHCVSPRGLMTVCARPHAYRSVDAFRISGGYPSQKRRRALADKKCRPLVDGKAYLSFVPHPDQWAAGNHSLVCFKKTAR